MENIITKGTHFSEYEAKIRLLVLYYSVILENLASVFLREILMIDQPSISFGSSSQALSMNQKVNLLLDTGFFDKKPDYEFIMTFMAIRNKFMHNADVNSFESCLALLTGKGTYLKNNYLKIKKENEEAGGEKAAKQKTDEEMNDNELLTFDISDEEKLLYKSWITFSGDVIKCFEKVVNKLKNERKVVKLGENMTIHFNNSSKSLN